MIRGDTSFAYLSTRVSHHASSSNLFRIVLVSFISFNTLCRLLTESHRSSPTSQFETFENALFRTPELRYRTVLRSGRYTFVRRVSTLVRELSEHDRSFLLFARINVLGDFIFVTHLPSYGIDWFFFDTSRCQSDRLSSGTSVNDPHHLF